jgi:hypothetical protein
MPSAADNQDPLRKTIFVQASQGAIQFTVSDYHHFASAMWRQVEIVIACG